MKVVILFHPESDYERTVIDYTRDFLNTTGQKLDQVSLDTVEGADMARLYDVKRYPAIIALTNDGQLLQMWQDEMLPTINEVSAYIER
jgi:hypothetical protein